MKDRTTSEIVALLIVQLGLTPLITMLLWNGLVPDIFGLRAIGFLEALGLLILFNALFNSTASSE